MAAKKTTSALTFEQAAARLDAIVARMEEPETGLEDMLRLVEEGLGLIRSSRKLLAEAELKIRRLEEEPEEESTATQRQPAAPAEDDGFSLI